MTLDSQPMLTPTDMMAAAKKVADNLDKQSEFNYHPTGHELIRTTIIENMESIPAGANPFLHDEYSMGTDLARGWVVMHPGFDNKEDPRAMQWLYLVNTRTGQRIKFTFDYSPTAEQLEAQRIAHDKLVKQIEAAEQARYAAERRERAVEECKRRYGHSNIGLTDDYNFSGHFFSGPEDTHWVVPPDEYEFGMSAPNAGAFCLCCWTKVDGKMVPTDDNDYPNQDPVEPDDSDEQLDRCDAPKQPKLYLGVVGSIPPFWKFWRERIAPSHAYTLAFFVPMFFDYASNRQGFNIWYYVVMFVGIQCLMIGVTYAVWRMHKRDERLSAKGHDHADFDARR